MKDLLLNIVQELVDNSDDVTVTELKGGSTKVFEIRAAKEDIGKIIGRKGKTIDCIRYIMTAISAKYKKRVILEIVD